MAKINIDDAKLLDLLDSAYVEVKDKVPEFRLPADNGNDPVTVHLSTSGDITLSHPYRDSVYLSFDNIHRLLAALRYWQSTQDTNLGV